MTSAARLRDAALLHAKNICLAHGTVAALDGVSLDVRAGELLTILGPSGSGKTSLLRVLAGLETPQTADALTIDGADMRAVPAHLRPTATVFQHYALFPHLTAGANVEYGLRVRGVPRAARRAQAERALALLRLADKYDRRIDQLSGGERQRVAFARALVTRPLLLLLDEPMGALDERLRATLEADIRALQQSQGMTIVQVTHSRDEALSMSDRIVVMHAGRVVQTGAPEDIFERPSTRFVAAFMGGGEPHRWPHRADRPAWRAHRLRRADLRRPVDRRTAAAPWPARLPRRARGSCPAWRGRLRRQSAGRRRAHAELPRHHAPD